MIINQGYMDGLKKSAKFFWRHMLTFYILSVIVRAAITGNVIILPALLYLAGAMILDWAKQFMKPNPNQGLKSGFINPSEDISAPLHIRQWWNSSIPGTPTNLMNNDYNRY